MATKTATWPALTDETLYAALKAVVAERGPDYIYDKSRKGWYRRGMDGGVCRYVTTPAAEGGEQAACLIGAALAHHGVPLKALRKFDTAKNAAGAVQVLEALARTADVRITEEAGHAVGRAQTVQDTGLTWGETLATFETIMGLECTYTYADA